MTARTVLRGVAAASLAIMAAAVAAGDDAFVVEPADARTNYFAGRAAECDTVIRGGVAVEGSLIWALAAGNRVLANGAVPVRHPGRGATNAAVSVQLPAGRDGVVADAVLTTVLADAAGNRLGAATRKVRIFPADPFFDRRRWLESLRIAIIDPEGRTERLLTAAGVPLMLTRADADIAALMPQVILVGEGLAWADHPRLAADLVHLCGRGVNVLCLAPASGTFLLPGNDDPHNVPRHPVHAAAGRCGRRLRRAARLARLVEGRRYRGQSALDRRRPRGGGGPGRRHTGRLAVARSPIWRPRGGPAGGNVPRLRPRRRRPLGGDAGRPVPARRAP